MAKTRSKARSESEVPSADRFSSSDTHTLYFADGFKFFDLSGNEIDANIQEGLVIKTSVEKTQFIVPVDGSLIEDSTAIPPVITGYFTRYMRILKPLDETQLSVPAKGPQSKVFRKSESARKHSSPAPAPAKRKLPTKK